MERCVNCQYYDRHQANGAGGKSAHAGQCRRNAPQLSPINPKNYMIEGVWPTVRDEDWCGEFKLAARRPESGTQRADALLGSINASAASAGAIPTSVPRVGSSGATPMSIGALRGNGD